MIQRQYRRVGAIGPVTVLKRSSLGDPAPGPRSGLESVAGSHRLTLIDYVRDRFRKARRETRSQPLQGLGGAIDAQRGRLAEFSVGSRTMSNVLTFFVTGKEGALVDPHTMGTFGAGILNGDKVIFDYSHRRVALVKK
jgi:hypothetical protein